MTARPAFGATSSPAEYVKMSPDFHQPGTPAATRARSATVSQPRPNRSDSGPETSRLERVWSRLISATDAADRMRRPSYTPPFASIVASLAISVGVEKKPPEP